MHNFWSLLVMLKEQTVLYVQFQLQMGGDLNTQGLAR